MGTSSGPAVVIIDVLTDYFDANLWPESDLPGRGQGLAKKINQLTAQARSAGRPVVWVRQEFSPDLSDAFPHMRAENRSYAIRGTDGCKLLPELQTSGGDFDVVKTRFSAFFRTNLDQLLTSLNVGSVVLAGITTSWCVRSTAVDAYQIGYDVVLVSDCLAGFNRIAHESSLAEMDGYIGKVLALPDAGRHLSES